jgi:phosphohistidine phosphatase
VLAPRGRRDAAALAEFIGSDPGLDRLPEIVLVSPAARTVATAELVVSGWDPLPRIERVPDLYGADPEEVLDHVRQLPDEVITAMVVGHNPTAHALAVGLIAKKDTEGHHLAVRRGFPTCALGVYEFDLEWADLGGHSARLRGLFTPPFGGS